MPRLIAPSKAICAKALFSCKILGGSSVLSITSHIAIIRAHSAVRIAFLAVLLCFSVAQTALAGIAASPCDPEYYNSLRSRAWLEAQREITQNQNLIVKPDSVLEYMCFGQFLNVMAYMGGTDENALFSESTHWPSPAQLGSKSMDTALTKVVQGAVSTYITANFSHNFLGGRLTTAYTTLGSVSGAAGSSYTCANMQKIWNAAKCTDFIADGATDGFYTFEQYRTTERRTRPTACDNTGPPPLHGAGATGSRWADTFNSATVDANTPWQEDNLATFFNLLDPANCSSALQISTGVVVVRSKQTPATYNEKVCVAPGCRYVPTGLNAGSCTSAP